MDILTLIIWNQDESPNNVISVGPNFKLYTYSFVVDLEQDTRDLNLYSENLCLFSDPRAAPRGLLVVQQQKQGEGCSLESGV